MVSKQILKSPMRDKNPSLRAFKKKAIVWSLVAVQIMPALAHAGDDVFVTPAESALKIKYVQRNSVVPERPRMNEFLPESGSPGNIDRVDNIHDVFDVADEVLPSETTDYKEATLKHILPDFLVKMESAYPGLRYVFIGRDTSLLASAIEAYYLSIGETGRVVHLDISKEVYAGDKDQKTTGMSFDEKLLLLRTNGFNLKRTTGLDRPFVFMDRTTGRFNSQALELKTLAFELLLAAGVSWDRARQQVGFVNLKGNAGIEIPKTKKEIQKRVNSFFAPGDGNHVPYFKIDIEDDPRPEKMDKLLDRAIFHGPFIDLRIDENGRVGGVTRADHAQNTPQNPEMLEAHQTRIRNEMRILMGHVSSVSFAEAVKRASELAGMTFPMPKKNNPDVRTLSEAKRIAADPSAEARVKLLKFFADSTLTVEQYKEIFSAAKFNSEYYGRVLAQFIEDDLRPEKIAAAKLFLAYDAQLAPKPLIRIPRLRAGRVQTQLEHQALALIDSLVVIELVGGEVGRSSVNTKYFSRLGASLVDQKDAKSAQITSDFTQRLADLWNQEVPTFKEQVSSKFDSQTRTEVLGKLRSKNHRRYIQDTTASIATHGAVGTAAGIATLAGTAALGETSIFVDTIMNANGSWLMTAGAVGVMAFSALRAKRTREVTNTGRERIEKVVDQSRVSTHAETHRHVHPEGTIALKAMCGRAVTPK